MSGDHDVCPNCGAEAMWCDCDPDRKVERDAYIRGAKDVLVELSSRLKVRPGEVGLRFANIYNTFLAEVATGDWPKGE